MNTGLGESMLNLVKLYFSDINMGKYVKIPKKIREGTKKKSKYFVLADIFFPPYHI